MRQIILIAVLAVGAVGQQITMAPLDNHSGYLCITNNGPWHVCTSDDIKKAIATRDVKWLPTEPQDVPAVLHKSDLIWACNPMAFGDCEFAKKKQDELHPSCTDKTRVLLKSEDGKYHCIKFGAK